LIEYRISKGEEIDRNESHVDEIEPDIVELEIENIDS
jgi:hypothetical protein